MDNSSLIAISDMHCNNGGVQAVAAGVTRAHRDTRRQHSAHGARWHAFACKPRVASVCACGGDDEGRVSTSDDAKDDVVA